MSTYTTYIDLIKGQVNKGIYVWDCDGELLSAINTTFIKEKEAGAKSSKKTEAEKKKQKAEWLADALKMYEKRKGVSGARAFDCSGLIGYGLRDSGAKPKGYDKTANGYMKDDCTSITKSQLRDGDLCFKTTDGKAHHVGVYVGGKIVEAKGRAYGVVESSLTSSWDKFGRLKVFANEEPPKTFVFTKNLKKGMKGDDVRELQKLLIKKGYALPKYGADGDFGSETDKTVRRFQIDKNLKCDGIAGQKTITALGGEWKK